MIETAKANGLSPIKYIQFILGDIPGTSFLEYPENLEEFDAYDVWIKTEVELKVNELDTLINKFSYKIN